MSVALGVACALVKQIGVVPLHLVEVPHLQTLLTHLFPVVPHPVVPQKHLPRLQVNPELHVTEAHGSIGVIWRKCNECMVSSLQ